MKSPLNLKSMGNEWSKVKKNPTFSALKVLSLVGIVVFGSWKLLKFLLRWFDRVVDREREKNLWWLEA